MAASAASAEKPQATIIPAAASGRVTAALRRSSFTGIRAAAPNRAMARARPGWRAAKASAASAPME